ncbi:RagB/SusD family nutrient uptake outer membrane protein [Chryseobacterium sp. 18068]|uniref:RagB/SusD family nutrient uptake outer membrane protein n=1 Tax=Chryseobacterium sp. 18068 TaxID=2681414 RepID=UPI001358E061|nr:RagB/SusD family nutrient uptake outer membrane protein [Chryseobacterium sp. 18068]
MKLIINTLLYTGLISILLIQVSCEKMIDAEIPANQIASKTVFESVQTADAALAGIYAGLWSNSPISGDKAGLLLSLYTDDLDFYATASTNGMTEVYRNQLIPSNPIVYGQWASAYQLVYSCNAVIEGCENSTLLNAQDKARISGEALLIRSLLFFYLQQMFGNIPYPVTTNYLINQSISKTPSDEVLQRIESDLTDVTQVLPNQYRNAERVYLNKKSAQLLLAKVYMTMQRWSEAETQLRDVLQSPLYQIQNDLTKTFKKTSTNILWQLKPANNGDAVKEVIAYYFDYIPPYNYALSNSLLSSFTASDLRKQRWMIPVTVGGNTWYRAGKYKNLTGNTDEYSVVFRIEEAYLLLAESLAKQNKISEAIPFINAIRQRAGLTLLDTTISQEVLLNEILNENRKEFFTETGHRMMDLKRMNKLELLKSVKTNWKSEYQFWPVPERELLLNPNLNPQNNGY